MIEVKDVQKVLGGREILKDINFNVAQGEIIGFLGQNGAGKTTLMRLLTTYFYPDKGNVFVNGVDTKRNPIDARRNIGYLPEHPPIYPAMTVEEFLTFSAQLKDIPCNQVNQQVIKTLEECQIVDVRHRLIGTLSKGFRQRVGIAQAIVHEPAIVILDEPTTGLDPAQIFFVRKLIKSFSGKRTVILSTHILSEIEQLVERVLIIKSGRILADEPLENFLIDERFRPPSHVANIDVGGQVIDLKDVNSQFEKTFLHIIADKLM